MKTSGSIEDDDVDPTIIAQSTVLNYVGCAYSGPVELEKHGPAALDFLVNYVQSEFFQPLGTQGSVVRSDQSRPPREQWIAEESKRRLAYSIWVRI